jgi:hypothetical protein
MFDEGERAGVRKWHSVGSLVRHRGNTDSGKPTARQIYGFTA